MNTQLVFHLLKSQINISASAMGKYANIEGTGTYTLDEEDSTFNIIVMAENGTSKEYKLNVSITDPNPIEIELNNEK